jgi:glucose/arabinose dehydrogenase
MDRFVVSLRSRQKPTSSMLLAMTMLIPGLSGLVGSAEAQQSANVRTGQAAYGDWRSDAPGVARLIRPSDMPSPGGQSGSAHSRVVARPADAKLSAPAGFRVEQIASGLSQPRTLRFAPNGDLFVAETGAGRITIYRASMPGQPLQKAVFAKGLDDVFGLAFYPAENPRWLYASTTTRVVRFPYATGDLVAKGAPQTIVSGLPDGGHSTRDIAFSRDGRTMYVAVGSESNVAEELKRPPADLATFERAHGIGGAWGREEWRADVLAYDPEGKNRRVFATGIRNCVAMALRPPGDDLWCATNERDMLGDDLPPDYATRVAPGAFYGWPWFYIGANPDPRHSGARRDLAARVTIPDVLIQPHSAPLGIAFYDREKFPAAFRGDAFVALHGSWNRARRTGYKIVRLRFDNGKPTGVYEDFVTGFVVSDTQVWGRPVSVAVGPDGALYFSEDGNGSVWRVAYDGG